MAKLLPLRKKTTTERALDPDSVTGALFWDKIIPPAVDPLAQTDDLDKWQKKALKRLAERRSPSSAFTSTALMPDDVAYVRLALIQAATPEAVKAVFAEVKAPPAILTPLEQSVYDMVLVVLQKQGKAVLDAIVAGGAANLATLDAHVQAALIGAVTQAMLAHAAQLADTIGPAFDPAVLATMSGDWVVQYTATVGGQMGDTTRKLVEEATKLYRQTPGMTRGQLETILQAAFSPRRAEAVAITAITEAASQGTNVYQKYLGENGIATVRIWDSNNDSRVCQLCGPLHDQPETVWQDRYPVGPPAHTRCRCTTNLEVQV